MTRQQIIQEARTWVGTRYFHQGRTKGVSVDCVGLVMGVMTAFGLPYIDDKRYGREGLGPAEVMQSFPKYLEVIPHLVARPGDVVGISLRKDGRIQHVAFLTDIGIIHTNDRIGAVVETGFEPRLRNRIVQGFRFPQLEDIEWRP